ncbi:MAG: response regulator transcription factor [Ignavibacteriales bacterium]|nr:response regulator transcription factor [Ignavibacteriales bacterium]MBK7978811.1 response regulator transcription factor [Ignavibacteriota bacterium]
MKKVVIVEDVKTIREGLQTLINTSPSFKCIGTYENFENFEGEITDLNPDIILIDLDLPGISGIEGIRKLKSISEKFVIIVLTLHEENDRIFEALSAGAGNYLVKNTPPEKIISFLKDAANGKVLMSSYIARKTIDYFKKKNSLRKLDSNEIEILNKITQGNSIVAIEKSLKMSSTEIKSNFKNIYDKLFKLN